MPPPDIDRARPGQDGLDVEKAATTADPVILARRSTPTAASRRRRLRAALDRLAADAARSGDTDAAQLARWLAEAVPA
jgi:hypothetical protein